MKKMVGFGRSGIRIRTAVDFPAPGSPVYLAGLSARRVERITQLLWSARSGNVLGALEVAKSVWDSSRTLAIHGVLRAA